MLSPLPNAAPLEAPRTVERRRRGRGIDVMTAHPTPPRSHEQGHLPTPVTERRSVKHHGGKGARSSTVLPTPQTLPRKVASRADSGSDSAASLSPPSPSGHTTFFLSSTSATSSDRVAHGRRPGLLFAQQMGLAAGPSTTCTVKFGGRLGAGVGMGGGVRNAAHGPIDKISLGSALEDNPFIDTPQLADSKRRVASSTNPFISLSPAPPLASPGPETNYIPQLLRPSAERSVSPNPPHHVDELQAITTPTRPKTVVNPPLLSARDDTTPPRTRAPRRELMDLDDNPFISKPGEVVKPHPTSEDRPLVTYVFRGAKKVFANPFVHPSTRYPASELDVSHPEFDTHPCPPPRLLWPTDDASNKRRLPRVESMEMEVDAGVFSEDDDEFMAASSDSDDAPTVRRGLLFGQPTKRSVDEGTPPSSRKRRRSDF
ncbi:hypothetical protein Q8F55_000298 [Vanrija albida]|uniref:Uncharacterized protein n=1 Tax=Vanrija albida TaxID=181172 RepID=A0ABR3QDH3_9TREE